MASTSIPRTMKGVLVEQTGGPEVLQYRTDLPVPEPREGEVLVKNAYIGVNYIDTYVVDNSYTSRETGPGCCSLELILMVWSANRYYRTGLYSSPKPEILGREAEGTIVAVGPGETYSLKVGDRVVWMGASGYAEYSAVPALRTVKIPAQMPPTHAVAALIQGLTALSLVRESYPVRRGDWVLVHAAAGGCGLWLCQLLRAIGARTIGTASTAEKRALAERNGAEFTIDSSAQDFVEQVMRLTDGEGVIAVFDGVGKDTFDADLEVVARKGTVVSFGNASGDVLPFSIRWVVSFVLLHPMFLHPPLSCPI